MLPYFVISQRPVLYSISSKKLVRLNQTKVAIPNLNTGLFYLKKIRNDKPKKAFPHNIRSSARESGTGEVYEAAKD